MKFYLSAAAGALGVAVTLLFIPEISTLDLREGDLRWDALKASAHCCQNRLLLSLPSAQFPSAPA